MIYVVFMAMYPYFDGDVMVVLCTDRSVNADFDLDLTNS